MKNDPQKYIDAIQRQGDFGRLFWSTAVAREEL